MDQLSQTYDSHLSHAVVAGDLARKRFLLALLVSTWIPLLFFILLAPLETTYLSIRGMKSVFLFLGTAHVPATLFFYTDKTFAHIIKSHKARYIYFPLLLTLGAGFLVAFSSLTTQIYLFLIFWAWQAFHYGRQNLGIYSFTSIAEGTSAPDKREKLAIDLATICGVLGTFRILGLGAAPEFLKGFIEALFQVGKFGYFVVIAFGLFVYIRNFRRTTLLKTIFFWTLVFFFLPIYLSNDINVTFLSYAIAHGLQYIIFMGIVSFGAEPGERDQARRYQNVMKLTALALLLGLLFFHAETFRGFDLVKGSNLLTWTTDFFFGAVLGATMAHFVIDAGAWRLSKLPQREYMRKRFGFVFSAASPDRELQGETAQRNAVGNDR